MAVGNKLSVPLFNGLSLFYPQCHACLGVSLDPISVKRDTVNDILDDLYKLLGRTRIDK